MHVRSLASLIKSEPSESVLYNNPITAERAAIMADRFERGLDLWTGEPLDADLAEQNRRIREYALFFQNGYRKSS